jgi:choice-of-anchor C domain-containing protein
MTRLLASSAVAVCAIFLFVAASIAAFPTITNGSFESGTFNPGAFTALPTGSTAMTGWTVSAGTVDYIGTYWQASNGSRSVDLNGFSTGAISQTFSTVPGLTYNVTFDMSGNPAGGPALKTMNVSAGGAPTAYSYDVVANGNTLANMKWAPKSFSFTATSANTTLTFASTTPSVPSCCYGPALDNVVVAEAKPATADACKNGGWQHLSDGLGHLFKNQGDCVSFVATQGRNPGAITP